VRVCINKIRLFFLLVTAKLQNYNIHSYFLFSSILIIIFIVSLYKFDVVFIQFFFLFTPPLSTDQKRNGSYLYPKKKLDLHCPSSLSTARACKSLIYIYLIYICNIFDGYFCTIISILY
jgi:hypothetical protein